MDVLIIENIFYGQDVPRIYDLKGSERSRWSEEDPSVAGSVLMDANLRESNLTAPLLVRVHPCRLEVAGIVQGLSVNWQQQVGRASCVRFLGGAGSVLMGALREGAQIDISRSGGC